MRTKVISTLQDYKDLGFSPDQILTMYRNVTQTYDLISRLVLGDFKIINQAVDDAMEFLEDYASYSKEELH